MGFSQTIMVVGGNHQNTLSIIRAVGSCGYPIYAIISGCNDEDCYVVKSKYVKDYSIIGKEEEVTPKLLSLSATTSQKNVVIICSDSLGCIIDRDKSLLENKYDFFTTNSIGGITQYMKKEEQVNLANDLGFMVPQTFSISSTDKLPTNLVYPCIVKPLSSAESEKRIDLCYNLEELENTLITYPAHTSLLIQEYIEKDFEIVVIGASSNGEIYLPGYVKKIRENKGNTSFSVTYPIEKLNKEIAAKIVELVKAIGYSGLFGVELIKKNNSFYFVEINLRNDATTYSLVKSGVNIPDLYIRSRISKEPLYSAHKVKEIYSMCELSDFSNCISQGISIIRWLKDLKKTNCYYYYDGNDIAPFRAALWNYCCSRFLNKILRLHHR